MKSRIKNLRTAVALAAVAASGALIFSTPASAINTEADDVLLQTVGFDFGNSGFSGGNPTGPASLVWDQTPTGAQAAVNGYLHFDGVSNNCGRIRLVSYDASGTQIGSPAASPEVCVHVNGHVQQYVDPLRGEIGAASVEVQLQSKIDSSGASWSTIRRENETYGPILDTDTFRIIGAELDFGSGTYNGYTAPDLATVTWQVDSGSSTTITPVLDGTLYMDQADDLCARIKVNYTAEDGTVTTKVTDGDANCAKNDKLHTAHIHLDSYHAADVYMVTYTLQKTPTGADNWTDVASSTPIFLS